MTPPRSPSWLPFVLAGLSLAGTLYLGISRDDREQATKISALEARQEGDTHRLDRIEAKMDRLLLFLGATSRRDDNDSEK